MISDNMGATLLDDNCLEDIFTMQSQFLDDFEFGLEANNIDTLLELFEEEEHRQKDTSKVSSSDRTSLLRNAYINHTETATHIKISMPKVSKSKNNSASEVSPKSKGISLLAKPKKSPAKRSPSSVSDADLGSLSSDLLKDHDYCLTNGQTNRLYNKLPDYLTEFSNISKSFTNSSNFASNESYDKIPNYIKGFLNLTESMDNRQDLRPKDDLLIELNQGYIEVSDVVFDNDLYSLDKTDCEMSRDHDSNSSSSSADSSSSEDSKMTDNKFNTISSKDNIAQFERQHLIRDNSFSDSCDKSSGRRSRSRSREQISFRRRRRRLSTRSSVDSNSDSSDSSSSCSSCDSYSSRDSDQSKVKLKLSNSIIRNDTKGQQISRKRSLKEAFCQKDFTSKSIRANLDNCFNQNLIKVTTNRSNSQDIEERKIIYVGKIPDGTTKTDIRCWFGRFGAIKEVSIHFRDSGDNYAFVTFHRRTDAFEAIEHANDDTRHPKFDLSFGGRRQFCKTRYEDLDLAEDQTFGYDRMDFDALLRTTQAKLNR